MFAGLGNTFFRQCLRLTVQRGRDVIAEKLGGRDREMEGDGDLVIQEDEAKNECE